MSGSPGPWTGCAVLFGMAIRSRLVLRAAANSVSRSSTVKRRSATCVQARQPSASRITCTLLRTTEGSVSPASATPAGLKRGRCWGLAAPTIAAHDRLPGDAAGGSRDAPCVCASRLPSGGSG